MCAHPATVRGCEPPVNCAVDRSSETTRIARRLERTADYLRYRPPGRMASDSWEVVRDNHLLWIAGGALAGAGVLMLLRARRS